MRVKVVKQLWGSLAQVWDGPVLRHVTDNTDEPDEAEELARAWLAEGVGRLRGKLPRNGFTKEEGDGEPV